MAGLTSGAQIIRVCRQEWDHHLLLTGALDEPRHHAAVRKALLADSAFVRLRAVEQSAQLDRDIVGAVRRLRNRSKPTARQMIATGAVGGNTPIQLALTLQEFSKERYEVPVTGETKYGPDLLLQEAEAAALELQVKASQLSVKAQYLLAVVAAAKAKALLPTDRLAKVWA